MTDQSDPANLARDFLDAVSGIEEHLKRRYQLDDHHVKTLTDVLRAAEGRGDSLVRQHRNQLYAFTALRNAISHAPYRGGSPIATPLRETVEAAVRIHDTFVRPPEVGHLRLQPPYTVHPRDPLHECLQYMFEQEFAQAPVYSENAGERTSHGLLTTNAVARWVAQSTEEDGTLIMDNATVEEVLPYREEYERTTTRPRNMHIVDAVELLLQPQPPLAIIITETGRESQRPLGMLVASDLPHLLGQIQVTGTY